MDHRKLRTLRTLSIVLAAVFCGYQGIGQVSRESIKTPVGVYTIKGDYYFDHNNYVTAISNYSKSVKQNPKDIHAILRMAEAHHHLGNDDQAEHWYSKALSVNPDIEEAYLLKYISILSKGEKSEELKRWVTIYNDRVSKRSSGAAHEAHGLSTLVLLNNLKSVNSGKSDLGLALYNDKLIFSSNRAAGDSGNYFLYRSLLNPNGRHEVPISLHEIINSGTSEGPMAIAQKPGRLFFTGTSQSQGDKKTLMEVFFCDVPADRSDKVKIEKLVIKNFDYGMGHPAVNSDGTVMYFTSSGPKNDHGFDLYSTEYNGKKWSTPRVLSRAINTHGDEMHPALYNDSTLYFASNGHGGLGGFDIYKINLFAKHAKVEHLDAPVNSPADDYGLIFNNNGKEGYLTSNRSGGLGADDLYKFYVLPVITTKTVNETITGTRSKPGALSIYTSKGDEIKLSNDNKGNLAFEFLPGVSYILITDYESYKAGTSKPNSNKTDLPKRNTYTFHIQKLSETIEQKKNSASVKDVHINPGDLITFQLIPNSLKDPEASESKIRFNKRDAEIDYNDTIVFSYVAEAGPEIPGKDDTAPVADLKAASKTDLSGDVKLADSVSSTEPILAKNIEKENVVPTADVGKVKEANPQLVDSLKNIASIPAASTKTDNGPKDLKSPMAADSLKNTGIAAKENVLDSKPEKNSASVIPQPDATLTTKSSLLANSEHKNNALPSKRLASDSAQSPGTIALQNKKPVEQDLLTGKTKTVEPNAASENAMQTVQPNKQKDIVVPDASQLSDSVNKNNVVAKKSLSEDSGQLSNAVALSDKKQIEKDQLAGKVKTVGLNAASENAMQTVQQNKQKDIALLPDAAQLSDSLDKDNAVAKNDRVSDVSPSPTNNDFRYRVQIAASKTEIKDAQLKSIYSGPNEIRSFKEDGYYKYFIEETPSYPVAKRTLKESNVDKAFISAYKGDIKWQLQDAVALQKKEIRQQTQSSNENNSVDPTTLNGKVIATGNPLANVSEEIASVPATDTNTNISTKNLNDPAGTDPAKENISDNKSEKNSVSTTKQADALLTKNHPLSDSVDNNNAVVKKGQTSESVQFPDAMALENKKQVGQDQLTSKTETVLSGTVTRNAAQTGQQNKPEHIDTATDTSQLSDSLDTNKAVAKKVQASESVQLPGAIALQDKKQVEQDHLTSKVETVAPGIVSKSTAKTVQQNKPEHIDGTPDTYQLSDSVDKENTVAKMDGARNSSSSLSDNDFQYRVQIAASKIEIKDVQLKSIYSGQEEIRLFKEDGYYKYYIGETHNYQDARKTLKESNVDKAFISAYKGDTKWKLNEAVNLQKKQLLQQPQPGSENKNTTAANDNRVVETIRQPADSPKDAEQVPATLNTNESNQDSDRSVTTNSSNSSEVLAEQKENKQDNKSEKNQVSTVTPLLANTTGAVEKNDFQYRVQIAASKTEIKDAQLKRIYSGRKEIHFFREDGYVKYYIEQTPNYYIARQALKESKVDSAFISAYKEDTKWRLQDAIASQYKVPPVRSELAKTDSIITIVTVNFELDEFVLSPSEKSHLGEQVIDRLKANTAYYAIVNGYTDIRGSEEYNFGLSQERAFFVEQLIVNDDINSERVTTQYFGESQVIKYCPEHENCDESVHQVNRRVEILLLMNKK